MYTQVRRINTTTGAEALVVHSSSVVVAGEDKDMSETAHDSRSLSAAAVCQIPTRYCISNFKFRGSEYE